MPLYRYECPTCEVQVIDLVGLHDPAPSCCGVSMQRLMPRRVNGWVETAEKQVRDLKAELENQKHSLPIPENITSPLTDDPLAMPVTIEGHKPYSECNAAERDARWKDTKEKMTAWQTRVLEASGTDPAKARAVAEQHQTKITKQARESNQRADGLT